MTGHSVPLLGDTIKVNKPQHKAMGLRPVRHTLLASLANQFPLSSVSNLKFRFKRPSVFFVTLDKSWWCIPGKTQHFSPLRLILLFPPFYQTRDHFAAWSVQAWINHRCLGFRYAEEHFPLLYDTVVLEKGEKMRSRCRGDIAASYHHLKIRVIIIGLTSRK